MFSFFSFSKDSKVNEKCYIWIWQVDENFQPTYNNSCLATKEIWSTIILMDYVELYLIFTQYWIILNICKTSNFTGKPTFSLLQFHHLWYWQTVSIVRHFLSHLHSKIVLCIHLLGVVVVVEEEIEEKKILYKYKHFYSGSKFARWDFLACHHHLQSFI